MGKIEIEGKLGIRRGKGLELKEEIGGGGGGGSFRDSIDFGFRWIRLRVSECGELVEQYYGSRKKLTKMYNQLCIKSKSPRPISALCLIRT